MFQLESIKELFSPNLYWRNPYNVLQLSVYATPKDIRKKKEDFASKGSDPSVYVLLYMLNLRSRQNPATLAQEPVASRGSATVNFKRWFLALSMRKVVRPLRVNAGKR